MTRLNTLLLFVLIGCALSVVTSQHRARKFHIELQAEQESERKLDSEWRELQIEAQTQGAGKRIQEKAASELGMAIPEAKKTVMVVIDGSAPGASGLVNGRSDQAAPHLQCAHSAVSECRSESAALAPQIPRLTPGPLPEERVRNDARSVLAPSKEAKK